MEKATRKGWIAFGLVLLVVVTLVMGWFAGRFVPADPKPTEEDRVTNWYPSEVDTGIAAVGDVDVSAGSSLKVEGVTQGYQYTYPLDETLRFATEAGDPDGGKAIKERLQASPYWHFDTSAFELAVGETKVISGASLKEWYPDSFIPDKSPLPKYRGSDLPGKAFLVTIMAKNPSTTESVVLPELTLWSADLNHVSDSLGSGAYPSVLMDQMLYPESVPHEYDESEIPGPSGSRYSAATEPWRILAPGEEREIAFPYYVFRNSFVSDEAFENIDLSKFCITANDYDPGIRYQFWLA